MSEIVDVTVWGSRLVPTTNEKSGSLFMDYISDGVSIYFTLNRATSYPLLPFQGISIFANSTFGSMVINEGKCLYSLNLSEIGQPCLVIDNNSTCIKTDDLM